METLQITSTVNHKLTENLMLQQRIIRDRFVSSVFVSDVKWFSLPPHPNRQYPHNIQASDTRSCVVTVCRDYYGLLGKMSTHRLAMCAEKIRAHFEIKW